MKGKLLQILIALIALMLTGCPYFETYEDCTYPEQVQNFSGINSIYDDYNISAPFIQFQLMFLFSSNRNSSGQEYDLIRENVFIRCDREDGTLVIDGRPNQDLDYSYLDSLFRMINTPGNELGPNSVIYYYWLEEEIFTNEIVYSSDDGGDHDLYLAWYTREKDLYQNIITETYEHRQILSLNTPFNECYIGFYGDGFINYSDWFNTPGNIQEIYFCSDRNGNYDVFMTTIPQGWDEMDFFTADTTWTVAPVAVLNSEADDKCPFISGRVLVFASTRPGGFGGYDLYYSLRKDETWTPPRNFGDRINTSYDEYRPVILHSIGFTNELMLFSSNRPGGKGGFDLYFVGIPEMTLPAD